MRIGYSTLRNDLEAPGDRRRFVYYANQRKLPFEIARPGQPYDLIVTSSAGDLSEWSRLPRSTKLVLDMVDSYLDEPPLSPRALVRGAAKFVLGHTRRLHLNYRSLIEATCRRADAVICATEEQRNRIAAFNSNVHVILDFQAQEVAKIKTDYRRGEVFRLVWEGLGLNLRTFEEFAGTWRELRRRHKIELHLVTHLAIPTGSSYIGLRPAHSFVQRMLGDGVFLHQWNVSMVATIATECDLAVIPIPLDQPFYAGKPANKLLFFWRLGLPVLTSPTPAYLRAMQAAGLDMTCRAEGEWLPMIEKLMNDEGLRQHAGELGRRMVEREYSEESLLARWDAVLASIQEEH
jgi:hypothetical protein